MADATKLLSDETANGHQHDETAPAPVAGQVTNDEATRLVLSQQRLVSSARSEPLPDPDDPAPPPADACCCIKWKFPWMVGMYQFMTAIPVMITKPLLITVQKDYFGSDAAAAMWFSIFASVVAVFNIIFFVAYGRLLDSIGRKPFFIANSVAAVLSYTSLVLFPDIPIIFMICKALSGVVQTSFTAAFIADTLVPEQRAFGFTIVSAVSTMSLVSALGVGVIPAPNMVFYVAAVGFSVVSLLMAIFLIPESLPKRNRKPFELKGTFGNPLAGAVILTKSKAMTILTVCVVVVVVADVGTQDVFMYYLNDSVGFTDQDNALFFVEMSIMSLIGYFVVTPVMMRYVSSITVLCIAVTANAALLILTATVWSAWCVFAFIGPLYGLLVMSTPLLNAMITNIGHERDVGKRITAMTAVVDFCGAAGPLIFGILYGQLPHALMALPFLAFAVMIMVCVVAQWKLLGRAIRDDQAKVQEELRQEAIDRRDAVPEGADADDGDDAIVVAVNGASPIGVGRGLYNEEDCE